jgi:hypothetical protein
VERGIRRRVSSGRWYAQRRVEANSIHAVFPRADDAASERRNGDTKMTNKSEAFEVGGSGYKSAKRIARNTWRYTRSDGSVAIKLHRTDVCVRDTKGKITLNSGGWHTPTTKDRINIGLSGTGYSIYQNASKWYVRSGSEGECVYFDGMVLPRDFKSRKSAVEEKRVDKLSKQIVKFAGSSA